MHRLQGTVGTEPVQQRGGVQAKDDMVGLPDKVLKIVGSTAGDSRVQRVLQVSLPRLMPSTWAPSAGQLQCTCRPADPDPLRDNVLFYHIFTSTPSGARSGKSRRSFYGFPASSTVRAALRSQHRGAHDHPMVVVAVQRAAGACACSSTALHRDAVPLSLSSTRKPQARSSVSIAVRCGRLSGAAAPRCG